MKKILLSLMTIAVVVVVGVAASSAFFTDTEESTGNTFTAGAIDLMIDNTSYYNFDEELGYGAMYPVERLSWELSNLTDELFFDFDDVKPGDLGEDTISLHITNNPAWVCADIVLTSNDDMDCNDPEMEDDETCDEPNQDPWDGDLAQALNFIFWEDDGDNVLEVGENILTAGPAINVLNGVSWAIADFTTGDGPMKPDTTYYIGKAWCFGDLTEAREEQDNVMTSGPDQRSAGVMCSGVEVDNAAQTDRLTGNIRFRAIQERHNAEFICTPQEGPRPQTRHISLENKEIDTWAIIANDLTWGDIDYSHNDTSFYGVVSGQGLVPYGYYQITLNGPNTGPEMGCSFTNLSLGNFGGGNTFKSGFWDSAWPNLSATCDPTPGADEEGLYNMNLIGDHYTFQADVNGDFVYPFDLALPAGDYADVKVLVKKMLDTHVSPWADTTGIYPEFNLYETQSIDFSIVL
jgi:predicted ribosomally synthesized peptide with SipW-like signal peptide